MPEPDYVVKPVQKALRVLRCLGEAGKPLTLNEIRTEVALPKSTVYKYLRTLMDAEFIVHDAQSDKYHIGLLVWQIGQSSSTHAPVREIAMPLMHELRDRFDETTNLGVMNGNDVVIVELLESSRAFLMRAHIGARDPLYCTSMGKAMLASLPEDRWRSHVPHRLARRTDKTITSHRLLEQDLEITRLRGYAVDDGENEEGGHCIGAAILDGQGRVAAAISVSVPIGRMKEGLSEAIGLQVARAAQACSARLGHRAFRLPAPRQESVSGSAAQRPPGPETMT